MEPATARRTGYTDGRAGATGRLGCARAAQRREPWDMFSLEGAADPRFVLSGSLVLLHQDHAGIPRGHPPYSFRLLIIGIVV